GNFYRSYGAGLKYRPTGAIIRANTTTLGRQTVTAMKAGRIILRSAGAGLALIIVFFLVVQMLSRHSPTVDIFCSYFPAWMVCILSGLALTLIAYWLVQVGNLKPYIGPAPLIYSSLMIIFTFATWILFYQN